MPAALAIARYRFRGREAMTALFMSPLMIPHVVLGIAFLRFFTEIGLGGTFVGLVLAHIVIVLPFALRLTLASAVGLDRAIEHAAVSLGASEWTVLKRITLPLVVPGLASGWALAFINSFDEVTMTVFIAAPGTETLPVRMFLYIQDNIDPLVTSVSACVIAVTVLALIVLDRAYGLERLLVGTERRWPIATTMLPSSAAAWSAWPPPGAWRARAAGRVLDEGDRAVRATRGNFALVWVQSKGLGLAAYAGWTIRSSNAWARLRPIPEGGDRPRCLLPAARRLPSRAVGEGARGARQHPEAPAQPAGHRRLQDRDPRPRARSPRCCPTSGPRWSAASYCPLDGHVNSLRLFRTLHTAINARGVTYLPSHRVENITKEGGEFRLTTAKGEVRAAKVALAAGNANMRLAPMVGLEAPMRPERGQIVVTERLRPFLHYPVVTLRQTDEGTVMIGDSKEESTDPTGLHARRQRHRGRARACASSRCSPTSTSCAPGARSGS